MSYKIQPGEGAFYGPKLEFALRGRLGRSWQCGTVQLDSVLPNRLNASYVGSDGDRATPVTIHHAVFGSIVRFIAMLLEHYAGALPFWLSPDQVAVADISHGHSDYATKVLNVLGAEGVRCVLFASAESLSRRIVAAHEASIPFVVVVGQREAEQGTVSLRERTGPVSVLSLNDAVIALRQRASPG